MKYDIDKTLSRLSHLSQIGLLLAAIFTIWYTVVPLYGKAVLEEQVAEKTIELKNINEQISKQYSQLKKNYIKDLNITYKFQCVLKPLSKISNYNDRLNFDVAPCLNKVNDLTLKKSLLNENDKQQFTLAHTMILNNLESTRKKTKQEFQKIEDIGINEIHLLPEIQGYSKEAFEFTKDTAKLLGEPYPYKEEFEARKSQAKRDLYSKYIDELSNLINIK
ncbi:hypothetical protein, partial [Acinetobacter sp. Ver3]|uniref:hypothetical protein n=1 Tax=Acinetobacter sp. Ver3 TaxID=466088 RepID=UPI0004463ADB